MEEGGEAEEDDSDHGDTRLTDSYLDTYELSPPSVSSFHKVQHTIKSQKNGKTFYCDFLKLTPS